MSKSINIKIAGQAGEGIKTTGLILSKVFARLGFSIFSYDEYPSLIRGGHNTYQMFADSQPVYAQRKKIDILIAFDKESSENHQDELQDVSLVLFDPDECKVGLIKGKPIAVPWARLAETSGGSKIMANMVSLGALLALCGLSLEPLLQLISDVWQRKGTQVVNNNQKVAQVGFDFIRENFAKDVVVLEPPTKKNQIVLTGNEAIATGAIAAGMKYFASYPMTPTSNILHFLAEQAERYSLIVNHAENEIAAINTVFGASAVGVRAMTATSGGGFALMVEGLGACGMAEVPAVIVIGTRPGPSSGMPTWTGQGDLRFALHASQDEFPRLLLTPGDGSEAFELTKKAFELCEKYQLPAIILVDKLICESHFSYPPFNTHHLNQRDSFTEGDLKNFQRYQVTDSGISARPILGQKGGHSLIANTYEHGPNSLVTEEPQERKAQMDKRIKKMASLAADLWTLPVFGPHDAETTIVGFGSTSGPVREALKSLPDVNYLHFNYLCPFPTQQVQDRLAKTNHLICLEANPSGQLKGLIRQEIGIEIGNFLGKYDGRPFYPEEIIDYVTNLTGK